MSREGDHERGAVRSQPISKAEIPVLREFTGNLVKKVKPTHMKAPLMGCFIGLYWQKSRRQKQGLKRAVSGNCHPLSGKLSYYHPTGTPPPHRSAPKANAGQSHQRSWPSPGSPCRRSHGVARPLSAMRSSRPKVRQIEYCGDRRHRVSPMGQPRELDRSRL